MQAASRTAQDRPRHHPPARGSVNPPLPPIRPWGELTAVLAPFGGQETGNLWVLNFSLLFGHWVFI